REGSDVLFSIEGSAAQSGEPPDAYFRVVTPDYFSALRIPLESGRVFVASDDASNVPVIIINQAMAETFFRGQNPIGRSIWIGKPMGPAESEPAPRQIIGIVGDINESSLAEKAGPMMFIPYAQAHGADSGYFLVRTRRAPMLTLPDARSVLHALDADIPLVKPETMQSVISDSLTDWRFHAVLLGVFGGLALVIAAIGVYGVISYSVAQRTHEIGVRMALGAQHEDVLRLVLGHGVRLALFGVVVGVIAALALTRLMSSLLFGVSATDPLTFVGVAVLLVFVAMLACYIPARRALRVDPMVALRYE
ncbi:MAG: FtsX-like permease family protein, partial [Candidatus Acidiferrales bacterium]